ncbi:methyl-accepting chemotaxis protein [Pseudoduganella albidiflava]|uniref:HAMP domain-containing protein n=1 Tax=Pseudoduganella albidiflava TaxID=321983 RepID=A0A411X4M3_9BURK|nr:methyl-accepting chemotaxis protein [Pseudoduganella albidiflava]QBI03951.1 HAMP domain-containing protein [Pseudoduganella albidiflava]GGY23524.1 methyl-accepting chemotaxis protein [Pseudoduganella albidiflava]
MKAFANMKIGARLGVVFTLVLGLTVVIAVAAIWRLNTIGNETSAMMAAPLVKERLMSEWHTQTFAAVRRTAAIVKSNDPSLAEFFKADGAKTSGRSTALIKEIEPLLESEEERALFKRIGELRKAYTQAKDKAIKARTDGNPEESARILNEEYMPAADIYESTLGKLVKMQQGRIDATARDIEADIADSARMLGILAAAAVTLGALCSWVLTRGIVRPIQEAVELAETVASGDLTRSIDATTNDETGALLRALRHMNDSLVKIVTEVRGGTETIAGASGEIAAGNLDLSSRTEQQAASLQETAASMEQITGTVRQNADNASQANQLAITASNVATEGGAVVGQVITTMGSINESSRKIVDIIGVIDGIAFQTNILALNAAVEAARAGEQGRGFAVVASEVRTLAQRSAAAAKEIKGLIGDSVQKVDAGAKLVDQAGATMEQVVESIRRVADIMGEITHATKEQAVGIGQVNQSIGLMDEATQQNAALVEQSAAAAGSMQDQAAKLAQVVGLFKLDTRAAAIATAAPALASARHVAARPAPATRAVKAPATSAVKPAVKPAVPATGKADEWEEF